VVCAFSADMSLFSFKLVPLLLSSTHVDGGIVSFFRCPPRNLPDFLIAPPHAASLRFFCIECVPARERG